MSDIAFIKKISSISVAEICRKKKINKSNMYNKQTQDKQKYYARIVRKEIENQIEDAYNSLYDKGDSDGKC
jgi:transketolase C-terminal domain/subunit